MADNTEGYPALNPTPETKARREAAKAAERAAIARGDGTSRRERLEARRWNLPADLDRAPAPVQTVPDDGISPALRAVLAQDAENALAGRPMTPKSGLPPVFNAPGEPDGAVGAQLESVDADDRAAVEGVQQHAEGAEEA